MRAMLLQAFYSTPSERLLMNPLEIDLLFRWFVDTGVDDSASDRLCFRITVTVAGRRNPEKFQGATLAPPKVEALQSTDYFSVDGTLIKPGH